MNDAVLVAVIGALALIIAALIARILPDIRSAKHDAAAAREQVENNHSTNLRVEQDKRHSANTSRLSQLEYGQKNLITSVARIEDHLGIERTLPRPPARRNPK